MVSQNQNQTRTHLEQEGYVVLEGFFGQEEIDCWACDIGWLVETQLRRFGQEPSSAGGPVSLLSENLIKLHLQHDGAQGWIYDEVNRQPWIHALAADERMTSLAKQVLGTSKVGIHPRLNMIMAMPGEDWHLADWHQDRFYGPCHHLVMYIPLQITNQKNGGLRVAKGRHTEGLFEHRSEYNTLGSKFHALHSSELLPENIVQLQLGAGDLMVFDGYLPHAAGPNLQDEVRFALTIRYTDLEDEFFINRGWAWSDLASTGLAALQTRKNS
jgi:ectoine hydroxylase-related dioxygenase (phytanoyl-CoA dioxygenase family)